MQKWHIADGRASDVTCPGSKRLLITVIPLQSHPPPLNQYAAPRELPRNSDCSRVCVIAASERKMARRTQDRGAVGAGTPLPVPLMQHTLFPTVKRVCSTPTGLRQAKRNTVQRALQELRVRTGAMPT